MQVPIRRRIQPMVLLAVVLTAPSPSFANGLARMVAHSNQEGSVADLSLHSNQDMRALFALRDDDSPWFGLAGAVIGAPQVTLQLPASPSRGELPDLWAHGNSPRRPQGGGLGDYPAGLPIPAPATLALLALAAVRSGRQRKRG